MASAIVDDQLYSAAMAHKANCLEVAMRSVGRNTVIAVVYDEVARHLSFSVT